MTRDAYIRLTRRVAGWLAAISLGVFAAFLAALVLGGSRFGERLAGVPFGLWLALGTVLASYAVVVAHARLSSGMLDQALRRIDEEERR